jgi:hypothetical protein
MALINLKRNWFGPDGKFYENRLNPVDVPEDFLPDADGKGGLLPPGATVVAVPKPAEKFVPTGRKNT